MKKIIVLPSKYYNIREVYTDAYFVLFDRLRDDFGFKFIFADSLEGITADLFLIQAGVHGQNLIKESAFLPSNVKVVLYIDGVHALLRSNAMVAPALERANYLLSNVGSELFRKVWPEYVYKFEAFTPFFAPHGRYVDLKFNEQPLMRCLLSGNSGKVYPLRNWVAQSVLRGDPQAQAIDIMRHPRWKSPVGDSTNIIEGVMGDAYAKALNRYFCSFVSPGFAGGVPAKYPQILAAGGLLLAEDSFDVREAGFVADKHYISVNKSNVLAKINQCLANPKAYRAIQIEGMEYARANHSINNRIKLLKEILGRLV